MVGDGAGGVDLAGRPNSGEPAVQSWSTSSAGLPWGRGTNKRRLRRLESSRPRAAAAMADSGAAAQGTMIRPVGRYAGPGDATRSSRASPIAVWHSCTRRSGTGGWCLPRCFSAVTADRCSKKTTAFRHWGGRAASWAAREGCWGDSIGVCDGRSAGVTLLAVNGDGDYSAWRWRRRRPCCTILSLKLPSRRSKAASTPVQALARGRAWWYYWSL